MNIAILIGVSTYKAAAPLPACTADVEQMRKILHATKKYEEIECLSEHTNADVLKDALRSFFEKHQKNSSINEVFFYFSGHGVHHNDALLCCSDFDSNRPASTSISNDELDDLLRSVSPEVAVKVIDACQSGSPYIKDANAGFEKALRQSQLKSFICMASSRQDQSSYASADASAFTEKWIDAAISKKDGKVLYRDIQASLADAFVNTPEQTPFFVIQGTGLEEFSVVTEDMRRLAEQRSKGASASAPEDTLGKILASEVARLDEMYVSPETVKSSMEKAATHLEGRDISDSLVKQFYEKSITLGTNLGSLPRGRAVADFAQEQGWPKKYFVKINTEKINVKVPKDPYRNLFRLTAPRQLSDDDFVTEERVRPAYLETTQSLPFDVAEVTFEAKKHPSLKAFILYIGVVHSLTEVMVLSATARLVQKGWDQRSPELSEAQWKYQNYLWKDIATNPNLLWEDAFKQSEASIRNYLEGLIPKTETTESDGIE